MKANSTSSRDLTILEFSAKKIQIRVRAFNENRNACATKIASLFRGYSIRRHLKDLAFRIFSCAVRIQRNFRKYLRKRNLTALTLQKKFNKIIHKRNNKASICIQKFYRGYSCRRKFGNISRNLAAIKKLQLKTRHYLNQNRIYKNLRSYYWFLYHSTLSIQSKFRSWISITKVQQIRNDLIKVEKLRRFAESEFLKETILREIKFCFHYFNTLPGQKNITHIKKVLKFKENCKSANLTNLQVIRLLDCYELRCLQDFSVSVDSFKYTTDLILSNYQISLFNTMYDKICSSDREGVTISDIHSWIFRDTGYSNELCTVHNSCSNCCCLPAICYLNHVNSFENQAKMKILMDHIYCKVLVFLIDFRISYRPKYSCCLCLETFSYFRDYYEHFDCDGNCILKMKQAFFFKKYWIEDNWKKDLLIQNEILRNSVEHMYVNLETNLKCFQIECRYFSEHNSRFEQCLVDTLTDEIISKYSMELNGENMISNLVKIFKSYIHLIHDEDHVSSFLIRMLCHILGLSYPHDSTLFDVNFLEVMLREYFLGISNQWLVLCKYDMKIKISSILSKIIVSSLRLIQHESESVLLAIIDFRNLFPREHSINNNTLLLKSLKILNVKYFSDVLKFHVDNFHSKRAEVEKIFNNCKKSNFSDYDRVDCFVKAQGYLSWYIKCLHGKWHLILNHKRLLSLKEKIESNISITETELLYYNYCVAKLSGSQVLPEFNIKEISYIFKEFSSQFSDNNNGYLNNVWHFVYAWFHRGESIRSMLLETFSNEYEKHTKIIQLVN